MYLGNMLSTHGKTASVIELLSPKLSDFVRVKSYSSKKAQLSRMIDMVWAIFSNRSDTSLVLIDAFSSRAFWYCYVVAQVCRFLKIPFIPILHGGDFPARLERSPKAARSIFSSAAVNISPSLYLKHHFTKANFPVLYIPNFLEVDKYIVTKRSFSQPKLLWVRSFHRLYNPLLAIEVLALLKSEYPEASLCMVGPDKDGSLAEAKKLALELGLGDAVVFPGLLSKSDWIRESSKYNVFINTTNFDNMPISVIEAFALGFPVVSTNVGGLPYLIDDGVDGLLVPPHSVSGFANAIKRVVSDPTFANVLAFNARRKAASFDWKVVGKQWKDVIARFEPVQ